MSVEMWNCHFDHYLPPIYICIVVDVAIELICCSKDLGGRGISDFECQWQHWTVKRSLCSLSDLPGGYIIKFTWCHTDISLYLPISWLFRMCSHWLHWKAKSSLWALTVLNGGGGIIVSFPYIFLLVDCFKCALIDHVQKQRVHSELWQFWMGEGGSSSVFLISSY